MRSEEVETTRTSLSDRVGRVSRNIRFNYINGVFIDRPLTDSNMEELKEVFGADNVQRGCIGMRQTG